MAKGTFVNSPVRIAGVWVCI